MNPSHAVINEKLLDCAVALAFEAEFSEVCRKAGEAEVSPALDRRVRRILTASFLRRFAGYAAAVCVLFAACVTAGMALSSRVHAAAPRYSVNAEMRETRLAVSFACSTEAAQTKTLLRQSAASAFPDFTRTGCYETAYTYIEQFQRTDADGTVELSYKQTLLDADGVIYLETLGRTVRHIVIESHPAILVFGDADAALLFWDENCCYLLSDEIQEDALMQAARRLCQSIDS